MAKQIGCRTCNSKDCTGCNVYTLATMLENGKFDNLMDNNRTIVQSFDVVEMCVEDLGPLAVRLIGDVAKVVRCKDCEHSWFNGVSLWLCQREGKSCCHKVRENDFCSCGERKENTNV